MRADGKPDVDKESEAGVEHPDKPTVSEDLRGWGMQLIAVGVLHWLLSGFLDPLWGALLIGLGATNLLVRRRGMYLINGGALFVAGLWNILGGQFGLWAIFGLMQLFWGAQTMAKYGPTSAHTEAVPGETQTAAVG